MSHYRVTVYAVGEEDDETCLGTVTVDDAKGAPSLLAMNELWDPRLDAASCSPRFHVVKRKE